MTTKPPREVWVVVTEDGNFPQRDETGLFADETWEDAETFCFFDEWHAVRYVPAEAVERLVKAAGRVFDGLHSEDYSHPSECGTRMGGDCDCWIAELRAALEPFRKAW